jgi:hypothetical protein
MNLDILAFNDNCKQLISKKRYLIKNASTIKTLCIGSSHGDGSFDPRYFPNSFNLCFRSADMEHVSLLYDRVIDLLPNIKNILFFYPIYFPGWSMQFDQEEGWVSLYLNEIFKLNVQYQLDRDFFTLRENFLKGKLDDIHVDIENHNGFTPNNGQVILPAHYSVQRRVHAHYKLGEMTTYDQMFFDFVEKVKSKDQTLTMVIPPARSDYVNAIFDIVEEPYITFFRKTRDLYKDTISFFNSDLFNDTHFSDFDHMSAPGEGPKILTTELYNKFNYK